MNKIFFLFATASSLVVSAQNKFADLAVKIDKDLEVYNDKFPEETVSLFTDKQEYYVGENIFLSTFLQQNGRAGILSKTLYVEFGNADGKLIEKKMLSVEKATASAIIALNPELPSGAYLLNAYTLWMKNTPQLIAQKLVYIVGRDFVEKPFAYQNNDAVISNIIFQAEGKSWSANTAQNFVLAIADKNGMPLRRSVAVTEAGKEVASAQTDENGMAKIQLTPKTGVVYQLKAGNQNLPLQLSLNEGIALALNSENKTRLFATLQKSPAVKSNQFLLVGMDKEKVCYQSVFDFAEGSTATAITKSKLPQGFIKFLLFDESLTIVAERDYFNYTAPSGNQGNNIVKVDSSKGILSVSIPSKTPVFAPLQNIISVFPEIQNKISYQVPDLSAASLQAIDAILLLQPTKYIGKQWTLTEPVLKYPVESGITLKGNIKPYGGTRNPAGYKAEIIVKGEDSTTAFTTVQTAANGDFIIPDLSFQKEAKVFFQGNNTKRSNELLDMQLYPSFFDSILKLSVTPAIRYEKYFITSASSGVKQYFTELANDPRYQTMEAVVIKSKARSSLDSLKQEYLTPLFSDGNATVLQPQGHYINIWHFLRGSVPGLQMNGSIDDPDISFTRYGGTITNTNNTGEDLSESFGDQAGILFFINEVQVSKDVVSTINPVDVALVSVNKQPVPALGAYNGVIAIFTKKGRSASSTTAKSLSVEKRAGYTNFYKTYAVNDDEYKDGKTVIFGNINKAINFTLPPSHSYKTYLINWNANGELEVSVH